MVKKNKSSTQSSLNINTSELQCACLFHSNGYEWAYVDRLYHMLCRNLTPVVKLHVFTELEREIPAPYIKHPLIDWGIAGPKKSWWYKMQMFNMHNYSGPMLYFDLDVVIAKNIDWIWHGNTHYFWAPKDFKYLWRPTHTGINSSVMFWDTTKFHWVWEKFENGQKPLIFKKYAGDQDFISDHIPINLRRTLNEEQIKSWRWQTFDGGYDFNKRIWKNPGTGTVIPEKTSVLVFHGDPKPGDINDPVIQTYWQ